MSVRLFAFLSILVYVHMLCVWLLVFVRMSVCVCIYERECECVCGCVFVLLYSCLKFTKSVTYRSEVILYDFNATVYTDPSSFFFFSFHLTTKR